jgi:hypothetical protein
MIGNIGNISYLEPCYVLPLFSFDMPTVKTSSKARTSVSNKARTDKQLQSSGTTKKSPQDKWDELLETPESEAFLTMMVDEVRRERNEGELIDGDWE